MRNIPTFIQTQRAVIPLLVLCAVALLRCTDKEDTSESSVADVVADAPVPLGPSEIRFTDNSDIMGLPPLRAVGVGLVDYNDDGWPDITLAHSEGVILMRNTGGQGFAPDSEQLGTGVDLKHARGVIWVDYDNDGDLDLFVSRRKELTFEDISMELSNVLLRNDGEAGFVDVTQSAGLSAIGFWEGAAFGDLDGDGDLDLAVLGGPSTNYKPGDDPGYSGAPNRFWRNNDGVFKDMGAEMVCVGPKDGIGWGVLLADLDQDGDQDVFNTADFRPNTICLNRGNGVFDDASAPLDQNGATYGVMGISAGDINGDGCMDLYGTIFGSDVIITRAPNGEFMDIYPVLVGDATDPSAAFSGYGATFMDADLDGDSDIFWVAAFDSISFNATNFIPGGMGFLDNRGGRKIGSLVDSGADANKTLFDATHHGWGVARGDYDGDGRLDLLVGVDSQLPSSVKSSAYPNLITAPILMRNTTPKADRSHLALTLKQPQPNARAVGATVIVHAAGRRALQVVTAGSSYLSAHAYTLHFGLGEASKPDWVHVRWPNGQEQIFTDVPGGAVTLNRGDAPCTPANSCKDIVVRDCVDFTAMMAAWKASHTTLDKQACDHFCEHLDECKLMSLLDASSYTHCTVACGLKAISNDVGDCVANAQCSEMGACLQQP